MKNLIDKLWYPAQLKRAKIVIQAYNGWIKKYDKLLDIGCGTGVITDEIRKHYIAYQLIAVDVMDIRTRDIPFKLIDNTGKLPFKDKQFDITMFNDTLHHVRDWKPLFKEALRVAKAVVMFEYNPTWYIMVSDVLGDLIHFGELKWPKPMYMSQWADYFSKFEYRRVNWLNHFAFKVEKIKKEFDKFE